MSTREKVEAVKSEHIGKAEQVTEEKPTEWKCAVEFDAFCTIEQVIQLAQEISDVLMGNAINCKAVKHHIQARTGTTLMIECSS